MTYYQKIDGLRSVAIAAVMLHHIAGIFSTYLDWGYFGVDLFFVISGFLITTILLNSKGSFKNSYANFLARRSIRIFPLYYFALLILYILGNPVVLKEIGYLLSYTFNYRYPFIEEANPVDHFWSLGVEEQYYLFWPLLVLSLRKSIILLKVIVIVMISFAYVQISFNLIPSISIFNYTGLPTRMGSLGLGSLGAMLYINPSNWLISALKNKYLELLMLVLAIAALITFQPLVMGLTSLFFVLKAAHNSFYLNWISNILSHPVALYIGRISYGLYVYHIIVIFYVSHYLFDPIWKMIDFDSFGRFGVLQYHSWILKLPLYTLLTIGISDLSYRYFEKPLLGLKDRFFKRDDL
jgi:peptidoglycan/LPS O-acetylase OafA/YrhL